MAMGAGELAGMLWVPCISTSTPLLLLLLASLFAWLVFSLFSLVLLSADAAAEPSADTSGIGFGGAFQRGISQMTPVKLLSLNPPLLHLRQGFPDLSSARRPALIAP